MHEVTSHGSLSRTRERGHSRRFDVAGFILVPCPGRVSARSCARSDHRIARWRTQGQRSRSRPVAAFRPRSATADGSLAGRRRDRRRRSAGRQRRSAGNGRVRVDRIRQRSRRTRRRPACTPPARLRHRAGSTPRPDDRRPRRPCPAPCSAPWSAGRAPQDRPTRTAGWPPRNRGTRAGTRRSASFIAPFSALLCPSLPFSTPAPRG